jgi:hypothetical protein
MTGEVFVEVGAHRVEARHELYGVEAIGVTATKGATVPVRLGLGEVAPVASASASAGGGAPRGWRPPTALVVASGVLAAGGIAAGAGLTAAANGKSADVAKLQSGQRSGCFMPGPSVALACTDLHAAASSKTTLSNAAASTFLIGGIFAAAGAGLGIWTALASRNVPIQAAPTLGATHGGLMLQGAW